MLSIFIGTLVISAILPDDAWESRWALIIVAGVLLAVVAVLRIVLTMRMRQSE
jgi:hypothetical protein